MHEAPRHEAPSNGMHIHLSKELRIIQSKDNRTGKSLTHQNLGEYYVTMLLGFEGMACTPLDPEYESTRGLAVSKVVWAVVVLGTERATVMPCPPRLSAELAPAYCVPPEPRLKEGTVCWKSASVAPPLPWEPTRAALEGSL